MKLPAATPVALTLQLPDVRVQLAVTVPTVVSDEVKATMPDGAFAGVVVSDTVAVQLEEPPAVMLAGVQVTEVEVLSSWTVTLLDVPALPL